MSAFDTFYYFISVNVDVYHQIREIMPHVAMIPSTNSISGDDISIESVRAVILDAMPTNSFQGMNTSTSSGDFLSHDLLYI